MVETSTATMALAEKLAGGAGLSKPSHVTHLSGGKNNRVFRVDLADGTAVLLKCYFSDPRDRRDRRTAEWDFLQLAWSKGLRTLPQPLATDAGTAASLLAFLPGTKLSASELTAAHVDAAISFVLALNAEPRHLDRLALGSEACLSLAQHLDTVERRVSRLAKLDPNAPHVEQAAAFVADELAPAWSQLRARIEREAKSSGLQLDQELGSAEQCISPSDFGFHNALVNGEGAVAFIDFEYAGRDDPAKLVSDFFCQPEIPVPLSHHARFVERLDRHLQAGPHFSTRAGLLLDAYRVKWTCIILNDFLPVGASRRAFAVDGSLYQRCEQQLAKAKSKLGEIAIT